MGSYGLASCASVSPLSEVVGILAMTWQRRKNVTDDQPDSDVQCRIACRDTVHESGKYKSTKGQLDLPSALPRRECGERDRSEVERTLNHY